MPQLEADARRVLNTNFPNSKFPTQGFKQDKAWWDPWGWM
jgi:outer membrane protein assembly factor BamD